jgi:hypothetical protein
VCAIILVVGEQNMNISQLGWCCARGFCVLGCCFLLVRFEFCWGFKGCGLDTIWFVQGGMDFVSNSIAN